MKPTIFRYRAFSLSLLGVFFLQACAFKQPPVSKPKSSDLEVNAAPLASLEAHLEVGANPNEYAVRISGIPSVLEDQGVVMNRIRIADGAQEHFLISPGQTEWTDLTVSAGVHYLYTLAADQSSGSGGVSVRVEVPRDLVIHRENPQVGFGKVRGVRRIFVEEDTVISLEDRDLDWNAEEVLFEGRGAEIVSFRPGVSAAPAGARGRSGGLIRIQAKQGVGLLRITGFGEKGGTGLMGASGAQGQPGSKGISGLSVSDPSGGYSPIVPMRCERPSVNGGTGGVGGLGLKGGSGATGGDSAKVEVFIAEHSQLKIEWVIGEGLGGDGGRGGPGGSGGVGGEAAPSETVFDEITAVETYHQCPFSKRGSDGAPGREGPVGEPGKPGRKIAPKTDLF